MSMRLGLGFAVVFLAPLALGSTFIVDDTPGAGVNFNDIPPAVAASLPGDVFLIAPGSYSGFTLGRGLVVEPTPGVLMERLVPTARVFPLGSIPATGFVTRTIVLPATLPPGFVFGAQAEVTGSIGLRRTNSMPVVVR